MVRAGTLRKAGEGVGAGSWEQRMTASEFEEVGLTGCRGWSRGKRRQAGGLVEGCWSHSSEKTKAWRRPMSEEMDWKNEPWSFKAAAAAGFVT